ncbi:MAG: YgiT-type zinc finger protein [Pseudonocardiaceae bacterium]
MRCDHCDNGERRPARRARLAERDGRTALVLGVPVEVCPACGQVWLGSHLLRPTPTIIADVAGIGSPGRGCSVIAARRWAHRMFGDGRQYDRKLDRINCSPDSSDRCASRLIAARSRASTLSGPVRRRPRR